jgi:hypothetical protein
MKTLRNRKYKYSKNKKGRKTIKNKKNKKRSIKNQLGGNVNQFINRIQQICKNIDINLVRNNLKIIKKKHPHHYQIIKKAVLDLKDYINIGQIILSSLNKKDINKLNKINDKDINKFLKSYQLGGGIGELIPIIILIVALLFLANKFGLFSLPSMLGANLNPSKMMENVMGSSKKANGDVDELGIPNESESVDNINASNSNIDASNSTNSNINASNASNSNTNASNSNTNNPENQNNKSKTSVEGGNWGELLTSALSE